MNSLAIVLLTENIPAVDRLVGLALACPKQQFSQVSPLAKEENLGELLFGTSQR